MDLQCSVCRKRGMGESQQGVKGRVQVCVHVSSLLAVLSFLKVCMHLCAYMCVVLGYFLGR